MASRIRLSPNILQDIVTQAVGRFVKFQGIESRQPGLPPEPLGLPPEPLEGEPIPILTVQDTLELWMLGPDALKRGTDNLQFLATPTGRLHHQLRLKSGELAYGRSEENSMQPGSSRWELKELFQGRLADTLNKALKVTDEAFPEHCIIRLLSCPAYLFNAIWVIDNASQRQFIVPLPSPGSAIGIESGTIVGAADFVRLLQAMKPVQGFIGMGQPSPAANRTEKTHTWRKGNIIHVRVSVKIERG